MKKPLAISSMNSVKAKRVMDVEKGNYQNRIQYKNNSSIYSIFNKENKNYVKPHVKKTENRVLNQSPFSRIKADVKKCVS